MEHGIFGWLLIIVALVFIFGGSKKLEDLGKGFGSFMREFNRAKNEGAKEEEKKVIDAKEEASKVESGDKNTKA